MPHSICKLCQQPRDLRRSHYLPAFLYRLTRLPGAGNPNPVVMTPKVTLPTSKQMQAYLLCADCERRFSEGGEAWAARQVYNETNFPLLDRLNAIAPLHASPHLRIFSATDAGIDTAKLAFFELSLLWRASVHKWGMIDGRTTSVSLGAYEEPIRRFLVDETGFPADVVVIVTICTDRLSQGTMFPPTAVPMNPHAVFSSLVRGIACRVLVGRDLSVEAREACCFSSTKKMIFAADHEAQSLHSWSHLFSTTVPSPSLG